MKLGVKIALIAVVVIVVLAGIALSATSKPSFCQTCHEMKDDYVAWQSSAHKDVSCNSCHIEPGALNFLKHKIASLSQVTAHISNNFEKPINKNSEVSEGIKNEQCTSCHKKTKSISTAEIIFNHEIHIQKVGVNCAYCHNRVAHPGVEGHTSRIQMKTCVECHQKKNGPLSCNTCHPSSFKLKPASHEDPSWSKSHGKGDRSDCGNCHFDQQRFCNGCHGTEMPHPKDWIKTHYKKVTTRQQCALCHETETFCKSCHSLPN
ncbi:MAG: NapC/NirT family cytochrome c [Actinomycetota bacterium]